MRDVARLAGVATSTVSRALARPGRVSEATRCRILAAAEQLGYVPNAAARNLRVGASNIVMAVLSEPAIANGASQVVPEVLQSVAATLSDNGFNLLIAGRNRSAAAEKHIPDLAVGGIVRGAILIGAAELPSHGQRSLANAGIPIVSVLQDRSAAGIPSVIADDRKAMREAVLHLIGLGHRSFFYIAGPAGSYHEAERSGGLAEALAAAGLPDRAVVRHGGGHAFQDGFESGIDAARAWLALAARPTAAVACWDDAAIAFMSTVRPQGVAVPGDLSVLGFDGVPVGAFCEPPLATLRQPTAELGAKAAEILLMLLDRDAAAPPLRTTLPNQLLLRASTTAPKTGGRRPRRAP
ncbi:LacI family DNA-binding transcriptional regulator [Inquilinus limosus]|uniref:LacI family transcriptional regulator n=1 Tax=Inquilinus limosus TaxID=171674 RepID=A0A211ZFV4_9PROT|nr:LacI family DNA-binding transcriptional regulator [Inquilinus limosus]OWJ64141.1 LacI family transcriptional regulator [Inquilinus limosus]